MIKWKEFYDKGLKKVFAAVCFLCLLFSLGAVTAGAQSTNAKITVSSCTAERGDNASISFKLEGNPGIWGLKLRIHYDHSVMTLKSVTTGSVFDKGEFVMSENLDKEPFVVVASGNALENKTANGTIVTLNFTVSSNAVFKVYPVTAEISQVNNVAGEMISIDAADGSVTVVNCKHADKQWRVTAEAQCEKSGTEALTCKKCGAAFDTRTVKATGHQHTEIRNAVAANKTAGGYTGDTYCSDCDKLIVKGKTIPKLQDDKPAVNTPETEPAETEPAVTEPTVTEPTVTEPTTHPSADTEPSTENEQETTSGKDEAINKDNDKPANNLIVSGNSDKETKSSSFVIITIIAVVLLAGGAVVFFIIKRRRG